MHLSDSKRVMKQQGTAESNFLKDIKSLVLAFLALLVVAFGVLALEPVQKNLAKSSLNRSTPNSVSTSKVSTTSTTMIRRASNGHATRLCTLPLKNYTDYSYCYWTTAESVFLGSNGLKLPSWNEIEKGLNKPIIGSNFTYADLSFNISTTDPSGMYAVSESVAVTSRPMHDCILANTQFAIDLQKMDALNGQPLDFEDFSGSVISGDTFEWLSGRGVNLSGANLSNALLNGSSLTGVIGKPKSLPPGWFLTVTGDLVQGMR